MPPWESKVRNISCLHGTHTSISYFLHPITQSALSLSPSFGFPDLTLILFRTHVLFMSHLKMLQNKRLSQVKLQGEI